jgi:acetyl esterase/lipase
VPHEVVRYGDHEDQRLELRRGGGRTALVLHGGFWRAGYTLANTRALAVALTRDGWTTANVEYRRLGPGRFRELLDDVAAAARALDRPALAVGHSAGGHLALWLAAEGLAAAAVPLGGVSDLAAAARAGLGSDAVRELLGGDPDPHPRVDPAARLPLGVPQLRVHGAEGDRVPVEHARAYAEQARAAGDDCRLLELAGADHFDPIDPRAPCWPAVRDSVHEVAARAGLGQD